MKKSTTRDAAVLAAFGIIELALAVLAAIVIDRETTYPIYLSLYFAMGIAWLAASYYALRITGVERSHKVVVVVFALALRVPFLLTEPVLSDDIYRYIWDGRVQHAGINPYVHEPEAPELAFLRNEPYRSINNKDISTIYPPLMQMVFFAATSISESIVWMKAIFVLSDVTLLFVLFHLLGSLGLNPTRALVYGWSPLAVVEVAGSGHNDALAVLFLMAALAAIVQQRGSLSMFLVALSGMAKIVGFALVPLFVRWVPVRALAVVPATAAVLALPYLGPGHLGFAGLSEYGLRWRGNDGLFHVLYYVTGSLDTAKLVVATLLILLALGLATLRSNPLRSSYLTVGAILLLTTTVHPWYLLWIAPFLAIYPSPAWMYLSLGVALGYHAPYLARPGQPWEDVLWVKLFEYVPFFVLAAFGLVRDRRAWRSWLGLNSRP